MSTSHDPRKVLQFLASSLDTDATLEAFPGLTAEHLRAILSRSAELAGGADGKGVLRVDGAARGNPGPAGAGFILEKGGERVVRKGEYLGRATNNEAEYRALILGMEEAGRLGLERLEIFSDSELMVRQMRGEYRVKSPGLQELYFQAVKCLEPFRKVVFHHVPREENREADRMANMAIDARGPISQLGGETGDE
jgi:ribonuclease HI